MSLKLGYSVTLPFQTTVVHEHPALLTQSVGQVTVVKHHHMLYDHIIISRPTNCVIHTCVLYKWGISYFRPICRLGYSNNQ